MTKLELVLLNALNAITIRTSGGQICFRTMNSIPMGMGQRKERIVNAALKAVYAPNAKPKRLRSRHEAD